MTKEEYFKFAEDFFAQAIAISRKKNADYTGIATSPFANFTAVEGISISTIDGFLTRMMDKMQRVSSFNKLGSLQVKDESVTDTLRDLANYSCLLAGYIKSLQVQGKPENPIPDDIKPLEKKYDDLTYGQWWEKEREKHREGLKFEKPKYGKTTFINTLHDQQDELVKSQVQYQDKPSYDSPKPHFLADEAGQMPSMHEKISNNDRSPAVSLTNTRDVFVPLETREEGKSCYGTWNGYKALRTSRGEIWPYYQNEDFGNGPGKPINQK